ncbi:XRE family transcriptional regulator [Chromohalobacter sp. TMW 2.2308]|uniref:XRE family transcriptional regulator n=1 Tax=Chromohalobacter moromii TaxID=2860329 RepID=A0A9X3AXM1_9GAMM|nr:MULTISPECIES: XRE family transcriptional regulator [Chromohalobacter]MCK2043196.1 XRE family transcriptional regulator [Chromohalobacter moromii]MCK2046155.1 XRE family transcriptional regulator [Chromohalobacter moromii]MCT8505421.1 XRE family transcriptional regulator [Chromohalobacter moromii]MCT8515568.1 XRE family transcriptional regulator [Chromohalobacter sp. TMW 2.2271]
MGNIVHKSSERPDVLVHVAANVRRLRQGASLSQQVLAERAGVSRRMLVNIEKGDVNVSLSTLDRLAEALGVLFYALVQPPDSEDSARIDEVAWVGRFPDSHARLLASKPARQEVELWSWSMEPGESYESVADGTGWHEMLVVIEGTLTLELADREVTIEAGDFHVYPSDQFHRYRNEGAGRLRFIRNVVH